MNHIELNESLATGQVFYHEGVQNRTIQVSIVRHEFNEVMCRVCFDTVLDGFDFIGIIDFAATIPVDEQGDEYSVHGKILSFSNVPRQQDL